MTRARDVANLIGSGNYSSTTFTATAGQTVFSIAHTQNFVQVFMNGLLLDLTVDYTSNGSAVTLTSGAAVGDEIEVVAYNTFSVGDALNQAAADTRYVNTAGDSMTGNLGVGGAANGSYAITSYSSAGQNLRLENDGEVGFIRLEDDGDLNIWAHGDENIGFMNGTGSGTTQMNIDGSGRVTIPNQPSFLAYRAGSNYTTTTANWEKVILDGTRWNTGSHYSTSNHRFTAPVSGVYHFDGGVNRYYIPAGNLFRVGLYVNGSAYIYGQVDYSDGTSDLKYIVSSTLKLDANDYVELWSYTNYSGSNGFSGGAVWNTFSGFLVG